ncbi:MAG TPA: IS200/IS605 family transposase [Planctomycetaceae bacterium]|nr:IS200/IS605 family transposase [Planctomycetaceae bacterium]
MPQSLANVLVHVVYSTKNRTPWLADAGLRNELHGTLIGTLDKIHCPSLQIQSVSDHIHILCRLARTMSVADLVEECKVSSSKWIKTKVPALSEFHWQAGYGAFSVSRSNSGQVTKYIAGQERHHQRMSFQDELRALLRRHDLEWDERYVWD